MAADCPVDLSDILVMDLASKGYYIIVDFGDVAARIRRLG